MKRKLIYNLLMVFYRLLHKRQMKAIKRLAIATERLNRTTAAKRIFEQRVIEYGNIATGNSEPSGV